VRIGGNLEGAAQVRLEAVPLPDTAHRRGAQIGRASHHAAAPGRGRLRLLARRPAHHHRHDLRRISRLASAARRIPLDPCPALFEKATAPPRRLLLGDAKTNPNFSIGLPVGSQAG